MKVHFVTRTSMGKLSGGDAVQILETKKGLEKLGITVTLGTSKEPLPPGTDLVHVFNPSQVYSSAIMDTAKAARIPVAISTIHWDMRERYRAMFGVNREFFRLKPPGYLRHYASAQVRALLYNYAWNPVMDRRLGSFLRKADLLLPNSDAETRVLERQFDIPPDRCSKVVNGFDATLAREATPGKFAKQHGLTDFVLCAGRIEYRKNQLALIEALIGFPEPLVFIGKPFDPRYTALCKELGRRRGRTLFIDHLDQRDLFSAYADARVNALVSWYETPGLASLEACAAGANLAVSRGGCTEEYFGPHAEYCDADDVASIRAAVERAWERPKTRDGSTFVTELYTWDTAGEQTLAAYARCAPPQP